MLKRLETLQRTSPVTLDMSAASNNTIAPITSALYKYLLIARGRLFKFAVLTSRHYQRYAARSKVTTKNDFTNEILSSLVPHKIINLKGALFLRKGNEYISIVIIS